MASSAKTTITAPKFAAARTVSYTLQPLLIIRMAPAASSLVIWQDAVTTTSPSSVLPSEGTTCKFPAVMYLNGTSKVALPSISKNSPAERPTLPLRTDGRAVGLRVGVDVKTQYFSIHASKDRFVAVFSPRAHSTDTWHSKYSVWQKFATQIPTFSSSVTSAVLNKSSPPTPSKSSTHLINSRRRNEEGEDDPTINKCPHSRSPKQAAISKAQSFCTSA